MKLFFQVNYHTEWGENLFITGAQEAFGGGDIDKAIPMTLSDGDTWTAAIELPDSLYLVT
ncbi:carbohydrate-binding module family 20 domain-containing protein [uncultured Duncaniella sp.]|nr:carbohydrate-binding module family 20 domain-containing protein [uncultured Duncaniella sp.]